MKYFKFGDNNICYYLFYYFKHRDFLSDELLRGFKDKNSKQIEAFSAVAADFFRSKNFKYDYIIRALGSKETTPKASSTLRPLCLAIRGVTGSTYIPFFLQKKETEPLKHLGRDRRREVLGDAYSIFKDVDLNGKSVLIVDDISTTSTTFEVIEECIKAKYQNIRITGFCLAKTKNPDFDHDGITENEPKIVDYYKNYLE